MTHPPTSAPAKASSGSSLGSRPYLLTLPVLVPLSGIFTLIVESSGQVPVEDPLTATDVIWLIMYTVAAATGALILSHIRGHRVGVAQFLFGMLGGLAVVLYGLSVLSAEVATQNVAALFEGAGAAAVTIGFLLLPGSLLFFPTGELPSPRWRPLVWIMGVAATIGGFSSFVNRGFGGTPDEAVFGPGPLDATFGELATALSGPYFLLLLLPIAGSALSLIVRYRRSGRNERRQIKWVAAAGGLLALIVIGNGPSIVTGVSEVLLAIGLASVPVAMAVAIIRYNLFDIDVVISKTVTFGVLAVFITAVYAFVVVGVGSLVGGGDEPSLGLSITAVAIVAVGFEPVRRRVQHWANVLVFGNRATPYEVLASATARLSDTSDPDDVLTRVAELVVDGTRAETAAVWLKVGDAMLPRASSPSDVVEGLSTVGAIDAESMIDGDLVVGVRHRGEVLGALSIAKQRGEAVTAADERMLNDLAGGVGVLLRNLGLNEELATRAAQLRSSRRRLVAAQDAERQRLERDLHDGAQQQVVALKVKLGIARTLAEREGAQTVASMVSSVSDTTQDAVDAMRSVAHGIYPPLLEAEGLQTAVVSAVRNSGIPVEITADNLDRYERSVEESVYFCVLGVVAEAIDAGATRAGITLQDDVDVVRFVVEVDAPLDRLVAVEDRVKALDGTMTVTGDSAKTGVVGELPVAMTVAEQS